MILCATIVQTSEKPKKWPTTFKKIGQLVIGNSYGHIHTVVDVNLMRQTIMHAIKTVEINKKRNYYTAESFELLKKQLLPYIGILDRIESGFFRDDANEMVEPVRIKRQAGLGIGIGVLSMGVSIYNAYKISKLRNDLNDVKLATKLIAQELIQENEIIGNLTTSMEEISTICEKIVSSVKDNNARIQSAIAYETVYTVIRSLSDSFFVWARGLESLLKGHLEPSFITTQELKKSLNELQRKAEQKGYWLLDTDLMKVYKESIWYISTEDRKIEIYIHIPLVDRKPFDLYEYINIPVNVSGEMLIFIEGGKDILAVDELGSIGKEMRKIDLVQCRSRTTREKMIYTCPNSGLLESNIKKTCLGAIMFGEKKVISELCHIYVEKRQNFHIQVGSKEIVALVKKEDSLFEVCSNGG